MQYDPIDYEAIQRRVRERVQRRYRFYLHSAVFILALPVVGSWGTPLIFLIWVGGWVGHMLWNHYQNNLELAVEQEIDKEVDRALKRKREYSDIYEYYVIDEDPEDQRPEWLGDDGELIGYEEDDYATD